MKVLNKYLLCIVILLVTACDAELYTNAEEGKTFILSAEYISSNTVKVYCRMGMNAEMRDAPSDLYIIGKIIYDVKKVKRDYKGSGSRYSLTCETHKNFIPGDHVNVKWSSPSMNLEGSGSFIVPLE